MGSTEHVERVTDLRAWPGDFPVSHLYTMGTAGERFFRELKDSGRFLSELKRGRIIGRRCHRCQRVLVPPRMFCERCFRPTDAWQHVEDSGTINTYSESHIRWDASRIEEPILVAVIEIDGASGGGLLHYLGEVKAEDLRVGMKVKAVWKSAEERQGSILDIRYFRPFDSAQDRPA